MPCASETWPRRSRKCTQKEVLTVLDSVEMALRASAMLLNSTMPQPFEDPSSCCNVA